MSRRENRIESRLPHSRLWVGNRENRNNRQITAWPYAVISGGKSTGFTRKRERRERLPLYPPTPPRASEMCPCARIREEVMRLCGFLSSRDLERRNPERNAMTATAECWCCRFFRHDNEVGFDEARRSHELGQAINGHCHRHCPVAAVPDENERVVNYAYWPAVLSDDWCGEYEAKTTEAHP